MGGTDMWGFQLLKIDDKGREISQDISEIAVPGSRIKLAGVTRCPDIRVVRHDAQRKLLFTKHAGYTSYTDRWSGNQYTPARFVIYEYRTELDGNVTCAYVELFGIAMLPINWKPGRD